MTVILCGVISYMKTKSKQNAIAISLGGFFFPIGGLLILAAYYLNKYFAYETSSTATEAMDDVSAFKFRSDILVPDEINVLPINDILTISDVGIKRERFLATIKKDISSYASFIKEALSNEDSETSHYAAAIIQETKRKMDLKAQELKAIYYKDKYNLDAIIAYADFLISYLYIDFFDEISKEKFVVEYIELAKMMIQKRVYDEKYIVKLIDLYLTKNNYEAASRYGKIFLNKYPESINKYLSNMKIYYSMKNIDGLRNIIDKLRESDLVFDGDTMDKVRFWIGDIA